MQHKTNLLEEDVKGFELLSKKLYELSGIYLPNNQKNLSLMAGRMTKVLKKLEIETYNEFYQLLQSRDAEAQKLFVEALTTHTTQFFREAAHFTALSKLISEIHSPGKEIRIWCGACSTGEEAYSLAITLSELNLPHLNFKILATDIDQKVVDIAHLGVYNEKNLAQVPKDILRKYFINGTGEYKNHYKVRNTLRNHIFFSTFNLIKDSYSFKRSFEFIFLRNVLIYFDKETISKIIKNMAGVLDHHGYLFVGLSEAGVDPQGRFHKISPGILKKTLVKHEVGQ